MAKDINRITLVGQQAEDIKKALIGAFKNLYKEKEIKVEQYTDRSSLNRYFDVYVKLPNFKINMIIPLIDDEWILVQRFLNSETLNFTGDNADKLASDINTQKFSSLKIIHQNVPVEVQKKIKEYKYGYAIDFEYKKSQNGYSFEILIESSRLNNKRYNGSFYYLREDLYRMNLKESLSIKHKFASVSESNANKHVQKILTAVDVYLESLIPFFEKYEKEN